MLKPVTTDIEALKILDERLRWLSAWTIHHANHIRESDDGLKVGGHQASCASMTAIMAALYFHALGLNDRVAVKPHAGPVLHAIHYLLGSQSREALEKFRGFGGAQSYPSRTKDKIPVDFSTGSVGLGVAITLFASLVQDYLTAHGRMEEKDRGRFVALVGDAELDEGNIYEALIEGAKHDVRNLWWIIDYNRQSLDATSADRMFERFDEIFRSCGWRTIELRYGKRLAAAIRANPAVGDWLDALPNADHSALLYQGGAAWRKRLTDEIGTEPGVAALLAARSDDQLSDLMNNLGGHCLETLIRTFESIDHDRPTVFLAYTIKGWGTPLAGHKDNHAGLMTKAQMETFQTRIGVKSGEEWDTFGAIPAPEPVRAFLKSVPFFAEGARRFSSPAVATPGPVFLDDRELSTQAGFGKILDALAQRNDALAARIVTTAPDVTVSTNLGPWVNRRGLFARGKLADTFLDERVPSAQKWEFGPAGQHIELGIAEMNLFLLLGAAGLSHSLFGERILPEFQGT